MCQDTGTAIVKAKKGQYVFTGGGDEEQIARGIADTYLTINLRYSQMAPLDMYDEKNTGTNLPAEIKISRSTATPTSSCSWPRVADRPTRASSSRRPRRCSTRRRCCRGSSTKIQTLGTVRLPAVPPRRRDRRHVGRVRRRDRQAGVGALPRLAADDGLASWPRLPRPRARSEGARARAEHRHRRPVRRQVLLPRRADHPPAPPRRVLPGRHGGLLLGRPPGARQDHREGVFLEQLETDPARFLPEVDATTCSTPSRSTSTSTGRWTRSAPSSPSYPVTTQVMLTGPMIVARDIAHAKIKERLDAGEEMPQYLQGPRRLLRRPGQDARRATPPARSGRPRPAGWTPTSTSSRRPAGRW